MSNLNSKLKITIFIIISTLPIILGLIIAYMIGENGNLEKWTIILSISTIYLGVVAAFQDFIRKQFYKPILRCELDINPPHCHYLYANKTYYIRFKIHNDGNISANNVEVFLKSVINKNGDNMKLSPGNLLWSSYLLEQNNSPRMYWNYISPGTYQYCNLGDIVIPPDPEKKKTDLLIEQRWPYKFNFSLYWRSIDNTFSVNPGIYYIEIVVAASNAKPINMFYEIELTGVWYDNERDMFSKSIKIF